MNNKGNDKYLDNIAQQYLLMLPEPLTLDEEKFYLNRIKNGDKNARKVFIERNLRLVVFIAKEYIGKGLDFEDLIAEGNVGLIKSLNSYDYDKNNKFSTYATWVIKTHIHLAIIKQSRTIRLPNNLVHKYREFIKVQEELEINLNRKVTFEEVANKMNISTAALYKIIEPFKEIISLNTTINDVELIDMIADDHEDNKDNKINKEELEKYLSLLNRERDRKVLELHYGINCEKKYTLEEVANKFNISYEMVRRIVKRSLNQLKEIIEKDIKPVDIRPELQIEKLYERFNIGVGYSKNEIDNVINSLSLEEQNILILRFDKKYKNPEDNPNWLSEYNDFLYCIIYPKIKKMLIKNRKIQQKQSIIKKVG